MAELEKKDPKAVILDLESKLEVEHFTVSASLKTTYGSSNNRDSFVSVTITPGKISLAELPLAVAVTERKVGLMLLTDAAVKGLISNADMVEFRKSQELNYERLIAALALKEKTHDSNH